MPRLNSTGKGILKLMLAGKLKVPKPCISRELQALEKLNIVEFCKDSRDGHQMIPTLKIRSAISALESAVFDLVQTALGAA
jgi:hypothetical protein